MSDARRTYWMVIEDDLVDDLRPLVDLRAAHRLVVGMFRIWDRLVASASRAPNLVVVRPALAAREREISATPIATDLADALPEVAKAGAEFVVLTLSRAVPVAPFAPFLEARGECALWAADVPLAVRLTPERFADLAAAARRRAESAWEAPLRFALWREIATTLPRAEDGGEAVRYPWDVLTATYRLLAGDLAGIEKKGTHSDRVHRLAALENAGEITILNDAIVDPFAFLDARNGPILIGQGAWIRSHVRITGPAVIGHDAQIIHGAVHSGTVIGAGCRIGGEVGESVFFGFANKAHEGYVGNSVICPWVNLGALTTTSNLKNTYGSIKVSLDGRRVSSGLQKLGAVVADHTKTAIGTLLGTGSVLGVAVNVFGGGLVQRPYVPAFIWGGGTDGGEYAVDRALGTARTAMERRSLEITPAQADLLRAVFVRTAEERAAFLGRTPSVRVTAESVHVEPQADGGRR
jgi:UDP-N-acetylglucosamine diphosphorylase/glucosamine-1-phosphate N-acetyltransferase